MRVATVRMTAIIWRGLTGQQWRAGQYDHSGGQDEAADYGRRNEPATPHPLVEYQDAPQDRHNGIGQCQAR